MHDSKRRKGPPSARSRGAIAALLVFVLPGDGSVAPGEEHFSVARVWIHDRGRYWKEEGFFELTPPIRVPSRDGLEKITVWLRIPEGRTLEIRRREDGAPELFYPPGTIADRVDLRDGQDDDSVEDVRGTRFEVDGEYFHVLRPQDDSDLSGYEWPRDSARSARVATDRMLDLLAHSSSLADTLDPEAGLRLFRRQNECAECHVPNKPERHARLGGREDALPNRKTDASGLYTVEAVLSDSAPLETHRAQDMNEDQPYVSIVCSDGNRAKLAVGPQAVRRQYVCDDRSVPYATFALREALAHGDPHAIAVCASRAYLESHMTAYGRAAYEAPLDECLVSSRLTTN
jgi:hypothetical protein